MASQICAGAKTGVASTWASRSCFATATALYVVVLHHADVKLRVFKSTSGLTWTEQDAADAPATFGDAYPFSAFYLASDGFIYVTRFSANTTLVIRRFNTGTDQWETSDYTGTSVGTTIANTYPHQIIVTGDDQLLVTYRDSSTTDTMWRRYDETDTWLNATAIHTTNTSWPTATATDSANHALFQYFEITGDDVTAAMWSDANGLTGALDVDATAHATAVRSTGIAVYVASSTDKIGMIYRDSGGELDYWHATRGVTSYSSTAIVGAVSTSTSVLPTSADLSVFNSKVYACWSETGTIKYDSTTSLTSITFGSDVTLVTETSLDGFPQFINGVSGLGVVYTDTSGNVQVEWIVPPDISFERVIPAAVAIMVTGNQRTITPARVAVKTVENQRTITPVAAAILTTQARTMTPVRAAILTTQSRAVPSSVATKVTETRVVPVAAAILTNQARTVPTAAAILTTLLRTVSPVRASILTTQSRAVPSSVAMKVTETRSVPAFAAILTTEVRTVPALAAVLTTQNRTVPALAAVSVLSDRVIPVAAAILTTEARVISAAAALLVTETRIIPVCAAVLTQETRTVPMSAAIQETLTRAIPAAVSITTGLTAERVVPAAVVIQTTETRTVPASASILVTGARIIPAAASILTTSDRVIPASVTLLATEGRTVPAAAAISVTMSHVIPAAVSVSTVNALTVPAAVTIAETIRRTVPAAVSVAETRTHTVSMTVAIAETFSRVIPCAVAITIPLPGVLDGDAAIEPVLSAAVRVEAALDASLALESPLTGSQLAQAILRGQTAVDAVLTGRLEVEMLELTDGDRIYTGRSLRLRVNNLVRNLAAGTAEEVASGVTGEMGFYTREGAEVTVSTVILNAGNDWYIEVDAPAAGAYCIAASLSAAGKTLRIHEEVQVYAWRFS